MKKMIDYPNFLENIFDYLLKIDAKPVIVGGYIRDNFLNRCSKDIDIEVYNIDSYSALANILKNYGDVNLVGKSFGVCKLSIEDWDVDFSLPRKDNYIGGGHKGFLVEIDSSLDFITASSRRDFTINAIGYDIAEKKILDPFGGIDDIKNKILKVVDSNTFIQDPLRLLRAMQFAARFSLTIDPTLHSLCTNMVQQNKLQELPKERIFEEFKKLFLKANKISIGLETLRSFDGFSYFRAFLALSKRSYYPLLNRLDLFSHVKSFNEKENLNSIFSLIALSFLKENKGGFFEEFMTQITNETEFLTYPLKLAKIFLSYENKELQYYDIVSIASSVPFIDFIQLYKEVEKKELLSLKAKKIGVLYKPLPPLIQGRDLLTYGLKPSKKFKTILDDSYKAQMEQKFDSHQSALVWLKSYLMQNSHLYF